MKRWKIYESTEKATKSDSICIFYVSFPATRAPENQTKSSQSRQSRRSANQKSLTEPSDLDASAFFICVGVKLPSRARFIQVISLRQALPIDPPETPFVCRFGNRPTGTFSLSLSDSTGEARAVKFYEVRGSLFPRRRIFLNSFWYFL